MNITLGASSLHDFFAAISFTVPSFQSYWWVLVQSIKSDITDWCTNCSSTFLWNRFSMWFIFFSVWQILHVGLRQRFLCIINIKKNGPESSAVWRWINTPQKKKMYQVQGGLSHPPVCCYPAAAAINRSLYKEMKNWQAPKMTSIQWCYKRHQILRQAQGFLLERPG